MTILVVTGVAREARIAAGPSVVTVCSGGSPERLRTLLARHDINGLTTVMSFGIGGGLNPAFRPGQIVVADAVVTGGERFTTNPRLTEALMRALASREDIKPLRATIVGVERAVLNPEAKAEMRECTGAAVVDMESHIAAGFAETLGLPFAALRVVCDPAHHNLPPLVADALNADGSVSLKGVFSSLIRTPGQIGDLIRLASDSRQAFAALSSAGALLRTAFAKA